MFYSATIDNKLRFDDVVTGYLSTTAKISKPFGNASIDIQIPQYSVILDPCCEIGSGTLSLSPLEEIESQFFDIPTLSKNMTLLNTIGRAKDLFYPSIWNKLSDQKKTEALVASPDYGWKSYFVYEGSPLFPEYTIKRPIRYDEVTDPTSHLPIYNLIKQNTTFNIRHRIINFKTIYRISCPIIVKPEKPTDPAILGSVILQLTKETRKLLREKMANYFGTPPIEDTT